MDTKNADELARLRQALRDIDATLQGALANCRNRRELEEDVAAAQHMARKGLFPDWPDGFVA